MPEEITDFLGSNQILESLVEIDKIPGNQRGVKDQEGKLQLPGSLSVPVTKRNRVVDTKQKMKKKKKERKRKKRC